MKQIQTSNKQSYATGFRIASSIFLLIAVVLLLTASVLRCFTMGQTRWQIGDPSIYWITTTFTYFGFIFLVIFGWFCTIYLFFSKNSSVHQRRLFVIGNIFVFISLLMVSFMWIITKTIPAFDVFDFFAANAWINNAGIPSYPILGETEILMIIINVIAFALLMAGIGMLVFSIPSEQKRHKELHATAVEIFIVAALMVLASITLFIIDNNYATTWDPGAHWLNVYEVTFIILSTVGIVLMLFSLILLVASSNSAMIGMNKPAFVVSLLYFILMGIGAITFTVLFALHDANFLSWQGFKNKNFFMDVAFYCSYAVCLNLSFIFVAFVLLSFGNAFKGLNK